MNHFRKKPVVIEAVQYTGHNGNEIAGWSNGAVAEQPTNNSDPTNPTGLCLHVETLEGTMTGVVDDWIIRGVSGDFYPCKPVDFEATYEPA